MIEPAVQKTGQSGTGASAMETPDRPKPWWAMEFPAERKTWRAEYIVVIIAVIVVMINMGVTVYHAEKDPEINIIGNSIQIKSRLGLSGDSLSNVDFSGITGISLIEKSMMDIGGTVKRPSGTNLDGYDLFGRALKGRFHSLNHDLGVFLLFVQYRSSPTIWIERAYGNDIYISFRDGKETEMLYNEIKAAINR